MRVFAYLVLTLSFLPVNGFANSKLDKIFEGQTSLKDPFELRDPFENPKFKSSKKVKRDQNFSGVWNDEKKLLMDVDINNLNISGVLIGKERRILIDVGGVTYKLKEEDRLGPNGPTIKAILPGGMIVVEQITNIYGEAEFIETVIPISK